jgi:hypothetical protein
MAVLHTHKETYEQKNIHLAQPTQYQIEVAHAIEHSHSIYPLLRVDMGVAIVRSFVPGTI